jgi:hypothetical protein
MAMSNANLERRIERNTNDIEAIYDILTDHGEQLGAIQAKLVEHDARFEAIDARFDGVDATLAEILRRLPEPPAEG